MHRGGKLKQSKGDLARSAIIEAASLIFSKKGFGEATFQDISKESGVRQSGIFYYFKDKEALIEAVMRDVIERGHQIIGEKLSLHDDAPTKLSKYFLATVQWPLARPEDFRMLVLLYYYGCVRKEFSKLYARIVIRARERILEILVSGQREGSFTLPLGAEPTAELLHDALVGGLLNSHATAKSGEVKEHGPEKWDAYLKVVTGQK